MWLRAMTGPEVRLGESAEVADPSRSCRLEGDKARQNLGLFLTA